MIIDCIADLHGEYPELQGGDLLIVAGDLVASDRPFQYGFFASWMNRQQYKKKILIAGNHDGHYQDVGFEKVQDVYRDLDIDYLCDSGTEFEGLKIWGSPWTRSFEGMNPHCMAFTGDEKLLAEKFALIPNDIDILITHGPPYGILDETKRGQRVGSTSLLAESTRIRPLLHIYGHIHEGYGQIGLIIDSAHGMTRSVRYVNCSHMNEDYEAVNAPIRVIL